ncbi:MAG: RsiV family protein [Flavobacteriaceae bacterium]
MMKKIFLYMIAATILFACKNDSKKETLFEDVEIKKDQVIDSVNLTQNEKDIQQLEKIEFKRKELIQKPDEKEELEKLLMDKDFYKENDFYVLDFQYPFLNENLKPTYANFNEFISKKYLNIKEVEAQILEDKELLCDTLRIHQTREKRIVNYKIYNVNEQLVSVLFYKENYYSGAMHPSFTFDCLNFDLERGVFMKYEDFFSEGSEEALRKIVNETIFEKINAGELFYDCWEVTQDDFFKYKNNFVVDDRSVEFYFEDCVICPAYTGEYSIIVPLEKLLPVLRRYNLNPLKV